MRASIATALALLCFTVPTWAANRALVVGNETYQNIAAAPKAKADARAYAETLRDKGFTVQEEYELTRSGLNMAIAKFVAAIEPGDTAVFVYSGQGWSDGRSNYLVGVDAPASGSEDQLMGETIALRNNVDGALDRIEKREASLRVAIIDASRDNPFRAPEGQKPYAVAHGLSPMRDTPTGTFVVFSAGAGEIALDRLANDDIDPNSLFTRVFVPLIRADLPLGDAMVVAALKVHHLAEEVGLKQTPTYSDEVDGPACLSVKCQPESGANSAAIVGQKPTPAPQGLAKIPKPFGTIPKPAEPKTPTEASASSHAGCMTADQIRASPNPDFRRGDNLNALLEPTLCVHMVRVDEGGLDWRLLVVDSERTGPLWAVPHNNEHSGFDTAVYGVRHWGGTVVAVETGGERYFKGQDPNRNFGSPTGGRPCPEQRYGPAPKYTEAFMSRVRNNVVIALHSNDPNSININVNHPMPFTYGYAADAPFRSGEKSFRSPKMMVFVAGTAPRESADAQRRIEDLRSRKLNVIYEYVSPTREDCSMSNYVALQHSEIKYFNLETPHGATEGQEAMLRILMDYLQFSSVGG